MYKVASIVFDEVSANRFKFVVIYVVMDLQSIILNMLKGISLLIWCVISYLLLHGHMLESFLQGVMSPLRELTTLSNHCGRCHTSLI